MDRTLVLLRHAKADRPNGVPDVDRPLTERGHADAAAAGAWLVKHGYIPDLVLCSPSRRTRQTWHSVAVALAGAGSPTVHYERPFYDGTAQDMLGLVQGIENEHQIVLLVGHNPTISHLSELLDPDGDADSDGLRTAGIAIHQATGDWSKLEVMKRTATYTARPD
jgi:phosphohistidine phosphatase